MKNRIFLSISIAFYAWLVSVALGQTVSDARISEFLASNGEGIEDEDGDNSDWIEVWNPSNSPGNLDGWFLTDDPTDLTKWRIPAVEIGAGEYLILFASGKERTDPAAELHTNFRLQSDDGGYLALVSPDGTTINSTFESYPEQFQDVSYGTGFGGSSAEVFVEEGDAARVFVPSQPLPGWEGVEFNDSSWLSATTGVGYDDPGGDYEQFFGEGATALRTAMADVNPSVYIRIPFTVANAVGIQDLVLSARWEDGFIAYLNGTEIHRERAPDDAQWDSRSDPQAARDEDDAVLLDVFPLTEGSVVQGTNVLAVQGLNTSATSSDLLFSPRLTGTRLDLSAPSDGFFPEPTPGAANSARFDGLTADTKFSVDRGIHETAFQLEITTATPEASIRFTTDGSPPDETTGTLYSAPIEIDETTVVRAIAFREGFLSTNVDTHTYLFLDDVADQPEMDRIVTQQFGSQMVGSLLSVPTIALSFDGSDIERTESEVSVELINFESGDEQINAGVARFGSFVTDFEKRSFRLHFRSRYGASRLEYPLFEETEYEIAPTDSFDSLDIRAGNHDMLARGAYLSNRYTDDAMLEMGNLSAHGRFVHIYFNGLYHGRYHLRERWDAAFASDYLPGSEEEYDTLNVNNSGREFGAPDLQELQDGDLNDWVVMRNLLDTSPTPYRAVRDMLDVPNLIDFMLVWTMGNSESEFRAAGSLENGVGFKFFIKDADGYLRNPDGNHNVNHNGPLNAMTTFRNEGDPDFMTLLADRIHKHFFNGGVLTPERNIARLQHRVDESMLSYIAEYARRTEIIDQNGSTGNRTPEQWLDYQENIINNRFPTITGDRLDDLRAAGMYPDIIAPVLSQHGGSIAPGAGISMSTNATSIFYTLDGSDPRLQGGAINSLAISAEFDPSTQGSQDFISTGSIWKYLDDGSDQGSGWRGTAFDDSAWSSGRSQLGYGESDEATTVGFLDTDPNTGGFQRNATTYFRHAVNIANPTAFNDFDLNLLYDDGAAVYINGNKVVRTANLPADAAFDTFSNGSTPDENAFERFTIPSSAFVPGENIIAVELHNESSGSSDISFDLRLRGEVEPNNNGDRFTLPIILDAAAQFRARAYNSAMDEWSALTSAFFTFNTVPASATNLVISEIHYRPAEPTSAEEIAESTDRDDYEFIELLNIGVQPISLEGVQFTDGITFSFDEESLIDTGGRAVLVRDRDAFIARYGSAIPIAGEYTGRLDNNGERLSINLLGEGILHELTYDNESPWPAAPDGSGPSLVLRNPTNNPDEALPESWGAHTVNGGAPGAPDTIAAGFTLWKAENGVTNAEEDNDQDGLSALLEYAFGTSPNVSDGNQITAGFVEIGEETYLTVEFSRNVEATDIAMDIQSSTDLITWTDEPGLEIGENTFRASNPLTDRQFIRVKVTAE